MTRIKEAVNIISAAMAADSTLDIVLDIQKILKKMNPIERLLLITLSAGVPQSLLDKFFSSQISSLAMLSAENFLILFEEYKNEHTSSKM